MNGEPIDQEADEKVQPVEQQNSDSEKLFTAHISPETAIDRLRSNSSALKRYREALEFLTKDSDYHIAQAMKQGGASYGEIAAELNAGAIQWQSQVSLMSLAAMHAAQVAAIVRSREACENLN